MATTLLLVPTVPLLTAFLPFFNFGADLLVLTSSALFSEVDSPDLLILTFFGDDPLPTDSD